MGELAKAIFADKAVDGMRPVRALIRLADTYSLERLAAACRRALLYETPELPQRQGDPGQRPGSACP